jgi:DNA (cytosine-5)-methyltransferase 1
MSSWSGSSARDPLRLPRLHTAPASVGAFVQAASVVAGVAERLKLLDLYCGAGGAGAGYARAGFDVVGVDIADQPNYPFEFHQADAIDFLDGLHGGMCFIENVPGAPLRDPVLLCGAMFGLRTYRHRLFEASWPLRAPAHPPHAAPQAKMGRPVKPGEFGQFIGNYSGAALAREVMQMPWANRDGIREAIPPAYTEHIGRQLLEHLR